MPGQMVAVRSCISINIPMRRDQESATRRQIVQHGTGGPERGPGEEVLFQEFPSLYIINTLYRARIKCITLLSVYFKLYCMLISG